MLHTPLDPNAAYRRVDFDARVQGADPQALVRLCFEEVLSALERADFAQERGAIPLRNEALLRALSGLAALKVGVDGEHALGPALITLYTDAGERVGRCLTQWDGPVLASVKADLEEIYSAFARP